jgi:hypothetical protein
MYSLVLNIHGLLALSLLVAIPASLILYLRKHSSVGGLSLITTILAHLQLVIGLYLYFVGNNGFALFETGEAMSNARMRFYAVEHITTMLIVIVLLTIARKKVKGFIGSDNQTISKAPLYLYSIGLVLLLSRLPWDRWPFIGS